MSKVTISLIVFVLSLFTVGVILGVKAVMCTPPCI